MFHSRNRNIVTYSRYTISNSHSRIFNLTANYCDIFVVIGKVRIIQRKGLLRV